MSQFRDFSLEVDDSVDNEPENITGSVTTAGSPATISATSTKPIKYIFILNPSKGVNANDINDVLYVNIDGGSFYITVARGESISLPVNKSSIKIDTNTNGTKYELILWS